MDHHRVPPEGELFEIAVSTRDACERLLPGDGESIVALLAIAAFQLQAAHVGARLADLANDDAQTAVLRAVATDYGGVSSASLNLAIRCSVTAVDLCASALARLDGWTPPPGRERDAEDVKRRYVVVGIAPGARIAVLAGAFLQRLRSATWDHTIELRHGVTHKRYTRGSYGSTRRPPNPPPLAFPQQIDIRWATSQMVSLDALTAAIADFADETFREFCTNLAAVQ